MTQPESSEHDSLIFSDLVKEDPGMADIVTPFVENLETRLREMVAALETADLRNLQNIAHQLKGSGGGYGYPQLTEVCARIEDEATKAEMSGLQESVPALVELVRRIRVRPG